MKLIAGYDSLQMPDEVFISYARSDREKVMPVVDILRGTGISVWADEAKIDTATLWSEEIVDAINNCQAMVVMLSQNSTGSDNIVKEVMLASENKKKNLPVHLQPTEILRKHGDKTGAELKAEGK